jgi:adenylate cyclase
LECDKASSAVDLISRLEALAKSMEQIAVCSRQVAALFPAGTTKPLGSFVLQGIPNEQTIFSLIPPHTDFRE